MPCLLFISWGLTSLHVTFRTRLENSSAIAQRYGWDIEFICDDTMKLSIKSNEYDFVYIEWGPCMDS